MKPAAADEENHSALNLPCLSCALIAPLALEAVFLTLAVTASPLRVITMAVLPLTMPFLMLISLLYRNWPTGIRLDEPGITFGAIRSRRAKPGKRHPTVNHRPCAARNSSTTSSGNANSRSGCTPNCLPPGWYRHATLNPSPRHSPASAHRRAGSG